MGGIIKATCQCGFQTEFMGGSGKDNFDEVCHAPALCSSCSELIVANYMNEASACEKCGKPLIFYNEPKLQENSSNDLNNSPDQRDPIFILPSEKCLCPKCNKKELQFIHVGCWA